MSQNIEYIKRINAALSLRDIPDFPAALIQLQHAVQLAPEDTSVHLLLGLTYQDLGQTNEARSSFMRALELDPQSTEARQALGILLVEIEEYQQAIPILQPVFNANPANLLVSQALASALKWKKQNGQAIEVLKRANDVVPTDQKTILLLTNLLVQSERIVEAIQLISKAIEQNPSTKLFNTLGRIHLDNSETPLAIQAFENAIHLDIKDENSWYNLIRCYIEADSLDKANQVADEGLLANQGNALIMQGKAETLWLGGKREESIQLYDQIIHQLQSGDDRSKLGFLLLARVVKLEQGWGFQRALDQIEQDLNIFPQAKVLLPIKAIYLIQSKNYEDAISALEEIPDNSREDPFYALQYFHALYGLSRYTEADQFIHEFIKKLNDQNEGKLKEGLINLGVRFFKDGNTNISKKIFELVLQNDPVHPRALNNLAFILIGDQEWDAALELLGQAEKNSYDSMDVLLTNRGYIYLRQQRVEQAIETLLLAEQIPDEDSQAILHIAYPWQGKLVADKHPTRFVSVNMAIQANLAIAYFLIGDKNHAFEHAQLAIDADPDDFVGHCLMGCLCYEIGNWNAALQNWQAGQGCKTSQYEHLLIQEFLGKLTSPK